MKEKKKNVGVIIYDTIILSLITKRKQNIRVPEPPKNKKRLLRYNLIPNLP